MSAQESRGSNVGWVGQTMRGKYRIISRLGEGGWGAVYEAEHLLLRRMVAIKVLHPDIAADPRFAERFRREALASSRIGHPNIIEVLDLDRTDDGTEFMVLELLKGESLGAAIEARGAMPFGPALAIMRQIASALAAAHRAGIVHRDMKPDNVFLVRQPDGREFVKLLDFGIAKLSPLLSDAQATITHTGAVLGTPYYMPPEQARGDKNLDHRADIYSFGVMMYEALTGSPPFEAENLPSLVMKLMFEEPAPISKRRFGVPAGLGELIAWMLAKEPTDRPASCDEVLARLGDIDEHRTAANSDADETVVGDTGALDVAMSSEFDAAADDDDDVTMVMASPLSDEFVSEQRAKSIPARASALQPSAHEAHAATTPDVSRASDRPSFVITDAVATPPLTRRENTQPEPAIRSVAPPRSVPPSGPHTTPKPAPSVPPRAALNNLQFGALVFVAFAALMWFSYWVVSHL